MNIEHKISLKAGILYLLTGIIVILVGFYIYNLRTNIQRQRTEIENQHAIFLLTNELIQRVNEVQLLGSQYIATNDPKHIEQLDIRLLGIDSLINILIDHDYAHLAEILQIKELLNLQTTNIYTLNRCLNHKNPLADIFKRLQEYESSEKDNSNIVTIRQDTIIKPPRKKNFFQRLKEVFIPNKDSAVYVINQRIDTVKVQPKDSITFLSEVGIITRKASRQYEQNLREIEQQISSLINADRGIASQISGLLILLHQQTLDSIIDAVNESEKLINKNHFISIAGGIIALGLILLFILLIIFDVNKGKQAREKLKQVMESRHRLLLSVSHDIKSPLSSILAYLELKANEGEDIKSFQYAAKHILAMLENLLEYSSLEQGSLQLTFSDINIKSIENETVEIFKPLAEAKGLSLTHESESVDIHTDVMKIKQIIINLISNAIKYTPKGEVRVQLSHREDNLIISVRDTGTGIPEDKITDIFKPFTRIASNNKLAHGSGFGMYVVKGLTDLLKGSIRIESEVNKGTTIEISIPAAKTDIKQSFDKSTKRIAVYEDDKAMKEVVHTMLEILGHRVVETEYDIILTDMEMGEITGFDILEKAGNIPVVLMTGKSDFNKEKAQKLGFADFIAKPFTIEKLRSVFGEGEGGREDRSEENFMIEEDDEIMELFRSSTKENQMLLQQALEAEDFTKAQFICHKMLPVFAQLGYPTEALRRMDTHRGKEYEGWRKDVEQILSIKV